MKLSGQGIQYATDEVETKGGMNCNIIVNFFYHVIFNNLCFIYDVIHICCYTVSFMVYDEHQSVLISFLCNPLLSTNTFHLVLLQCVMMRV